jgi:hypothetical protein
MVFSDRKKEGGARGGEGRQPWCGRCLVMSMFHTEDTAATEEAAHRAGPGHRPLPPFQNEKEDRK